MPNWEWRVFAPASPSFSLPSELWTLIGVSPARGEPDRTDVYLTCTPGAGLKLRYGTEVEIKLRQAVCSDGTEAWKKVVSTTLPRGIDSQDKVAVGDVFKRELIRLQPKTAKSGLKESLEEALSALSSPQQFVTVTKSRVKKHTFRLDVDSVEETIVSVSVGGEAVRVWRSVCLEASQPEAINRTLAKRVSPEGREEMSLKEYLETSGTVKAYPLFIMQN